MCDCDICQKNPAVTTATALKQAKKTRICHCLEICLLANEMKQKLALKKSAKKKSHQKKLASQLNELEAGT